MSSASLLSSRVAIRVDQFTGCIPSPSTTSSCSTSVAALSAWWWVVNWRSSNSRAIASVVQSAATVVMIWTVFSPLPVKVCSSLSLGLSACYVCVCVGKGEGGFELLQWYCITTTWNWFCIYSLHTQMRDVLHSFSLRLLVCLFVRSSFTIISHWNNNSIWCYQSDLKY